MSNLLPLGATEIRSTEKSLNLPCEFTVSIPGRRAGEIPPSDFALLPCWHQRAPTLCCWSVPMGLFAGNCLDLRTQVCRPSPHRCAADSVLVGFASFAPNGALNAAESRTLALLRPISQMHSRQGVARSRTTLISHLRVGSRTGAAVPPGPCPTISYGLRIDRRAWSPCPLDCSDSRSVLRGE